MQAGAHLNVQAGAAIDLLHTLRLAQFPQLRRGFGVAQREAGINICGGDGGSRGQRARGQGGDAQHADQRTR